MADKLLPWFKFFATDWLSDANVRLMTSRQRGWYIDLLCWAWQENGFRPEHSEVICQILRDRDYIDHLASSSEISAEIYGDLRDELTSVVALFTVDMGGGKVSHRKLEEQRSTALTATLAKSEAARSTNAKRDAKRTLRASDSVSVSLSESKESVSEEKKGLLQRFSSVIDIWQAPCGHCGTMFPCNQVELGYAAWERLVDQGRITAATITEVLEGLQRHRESALWHKNNGQYVMAVSTFLGYQSNGLPAAPRWTDRPAKEEF